MRTRGSTIAALVLVCAGFLSACTLANRSGTPAPVRDATDSSWKLQEMLAYLDQTADFDGPRLRQEYEKVRARYREQADPEQRLKLAWLLAIPRSEIENTNRSLELLKDFPGNREEGIHQLASLLRAMLEEQRRQGAAQGLLRRDLQVLQRRNEELEKKIEALTAIEKTMSGREPPAAEE